MAKPKPEGKGDPKATDRDSLAGSSATGIGAGTVIVALAHLAPPAWRETITLAAPALTLGVTGGALWARSRLRQFRYERSRSLGESRLRAALEDILNDPHLTENEKNEARQAYASTKLQRFGYASKQAHAPTDALDHEGLERSSQPALDERNHDAEERA